MAVRFKIRAHTSVSGPHRWAWLSGMLESPIGPILAWSMIEGAAAVSEGIDDAQGRHVPDPSPEQMAECLREWQTAYHLPGEVWGLEFVYLDRGPS